MSIEELTQAWVEKIRRTDMEFTNGHKVYDAAAIDAMVAEILQEGFQAGLNVATKPSKERRTVRRFSFDTKKLQGMARGKMIQENLTWQQVSDATGITIAPLKQHLGDEPPKEAGVKVVVSLMAWLNELDLLTFLDEEQEQL